jgi:prophage regulatory protein
VADVLPLRPVAANSANAPLVVDAKGLAALLSMGVRTIRTHDAAGKLPAPVRIGGRVVWRVDEIRAWLEAGAPDRETWAARRAARK